MTKIPAEFEEGKLSSDLFKVIKYTNESAVTVQASGTIETRLTTSDDFSGYKPIGIVYVDPGSARLAPTFYNAATLTSGKNIDLANTTSSSVTVQAGKIILSIMGVKVS